MFIKRATTKHRNRIKICEVRAQKTQTDRNLSKMNRIENGPVTWSQALYSLIFTTQKSPHHCSFLSIEFRSHTCSFRSIEVSTLLSSCSTEDQNICSLAAQYIWVFFCHATIAQTYVCVWITFARASYVLHDSVVRITFLWFLFSLTI